MKIKFVVFTFFVLSLAFVLCGAGCGNIAASSDSSYSGGNSNSGGGYTPPLVDNNPVTCIQHDWICNYIGVDNGTYYHKTYCSICGLVAYEKQECSPSFNCKDCGHTTNTSSYNRDFISIDNNTDKPKIIIVASQDFENTGVVEKYVNYKTSKGFTCVVKYYSKDTPNTTIRSELKSEYNQNNNMAVLIMGRGGTELPCSIPEFVGKNKPNIQGKDRIAATDFWYGFYEETSTNLFPQAVVGRLSARNKTELESQINKIIEVENNPPTANKNIVLVQHIDNAGKAYFSDEPKAIKEYFGSNSRYQIKDAATNNPSGINSTINQGALLVSYSGHGGTYFWGSTNYNVNNVSSLQNNCYPVVLGVTCNSANYTYGDVCMAEAFMRNSHGGAIGYIGASDVMIADYSKMATVGNSTICGMIGSLFGSDRYKVHTLGGLYLAALRAIKMSDIGFSDLFKGYSIEVLNLFGDPTMNIDYISR